MACVAWLCRRRDVAGYYIARYRMIGDQAPHEGFRVLREIPQAACTLFTEFLLQHVLIDALTSDHLTTVASRSTGADPLSLQDGNAKSARAQVQRCRESGVAAADDTDIEALVT